MSGYDWVHAGTAGIALVVAVLATIGLVRNRPIDWPTFWIAAALEVVVVGGLVVEIVRLASASGTAPVATVLGYAIAAVLLMPLAVVWAMIDRSRYGLGAVVVGTLSLMIIMLRLHQVWEAAGG